MASSLAEQLQPLAERWRQSRTIIQPILQSEVDLGDQDPARATDVVLRWLECKSGSKLPASAWTQDAFVLPPDVGQSVEVIRHQDPWVLASRLVDPDRDVAGRNWIVETAVFWASGQTRLALRLSCSARGDLGDFLPAAPTFLRSLAHEAGIEFAGQGLPLNAIPVESVEDAKRFGDWIEDPDRRLPIIAISSASQGAEGTWLIDPGRLSRALVGLAYVYAVSWEAAFELSRRFDRKWSVFQGACRLYQVSFDQGLQTPYDHPLLLANRLASADGAARGRAWLQREAARISVQQAEIYQRLPRFEDLRTLLARLETERQLETAAAQDRQPLLERQIELLDSEKQAAWDQAVEFERRWSETNDDLDEARRGNAALRARIDTLEAVLKSVPRETRADSPGSFAELPEWVEREFPDRLILARKAHKAVRASTYDNLQLVCDALEMLATRYVDMRRYGGRAGFQTRLRELHLTDEPVAANPDRLKRDPQFWCRHEGRQLFMDRHIKKGISRDPRECLRVYYAWDDEAQQVVVGHLTSHLETEIS